jgi:hypothetical protein
MKLVKLLDRGRVTDYVGSFPHCILVTTRPGDVMLQDITFTAEYVIEHVLTPLHQHRMSLSQDAARQKSNLHFDNSECQTAQSVADEMAKLRSKRGAHPPDSHDRAICDFCLFSRQRNKLAGFQADDDAELLRNGQGILTAIDRTEIKNAFGHWIERCHWVATNKGEYDPEKQITTFVFFCNQAPIANTSKSYHCQKRCIVHFVQLWERAPAKNCLILDISL